MTLTVTGAAPRYSANWRASRASTGPSGCADIGMRKNARRPCFANSPRYRPAGQAFGLRNNTSGHIHIDGLSFALPKEVCESRHRTYVRYFDGGGNITLELRMWACGYQASCDIGPIFYHLHKSMEFRKHYGTGNPRRRVRSAARLPVQSNCRPERGSLRSNNTHRMASA